MNYQQHGSKIGFFLVALLLPAGLGLVPGRAEEPKPGTPKKLASPHADHLDLVLASEEKLVHVQLLVEVDGQPLAKIWDETFTRLLAFYDRNGDGFLDEKEAARLPSPLALRQALGSGFVPALGQPPFWKDLDLDGDGRVSRDELADFYRRAGLGDVQIGVGKLPATVELTDALIKHLGVQEKDWKAAPETLRKLDRNDDELIGAGELVPKAIYPGAAGTLRLTAPAPSDKPLPEVLAQLPLLVLPTRETDTHWAATLVQRRDRNGDGRLDLKESGLDKAVFAKLDADKDGKLTAEELAGWRKLDPDVRWCIRFGKRKESQAAVEELGGRPDRKIMEREKLLFSQGSLQLETRTDDGKLTAAVMAARKHFLAQFAAAEDKPDTSPLPPRGRRTRNEDLGSLIDAADRDGDGKLSAQELEAWLDLQQQVAKGQVLLTVLDCGAGLFELLDTNHDGALSIPELRGAWGRLKEASCLTEDRLDRTKLPHLLLATVSQGYPLSALGQARRRGPAWFLAMDRNGDGYVSRREFLGSDEDFRRLDLDGDGLISVEEAERAEKEGKTPKQPK